MGADDVERGAIDTGEEGKPDREALGQQVEDRANEARDTHGYQVLSLCRWQRRPRSPRLLSGGAIHVCPSPASVLVARAPGDLAPVCLTQKHPHYPPMVLLPHTRPSVVAA